LDKLQAMTTFVRIVEGGSLTRAAEALGTSLPSVVRTLAALEHDVGVRLLNRTTRRIHLTDEGSLYLEQCRAILTAVRDADASLAARQSEPRGRLAMTAPVLFGRRHVAPIVTDFLRRHAEVNADLLLLDRPVNLLEEGLDAGVRIGVLADSSLVAIPVGTLRRVVCASPDYLRKHGVPKTPDDLRDHACVRVSGLSTAGDWRFKAGRRSVGVAIRARFATNQVDAGVAACENGLGPGMFLSYQVAASIAQRKLRYILSSFEPDPVPINVIYPSARLRSGTLRAFVDFAVPVLRAARFA